MFPESYGRYHHMFASLFFLDAAKNITFFRLTGLLAQFGGSQGPDLNRSIVDLQSTAWPLRHLGLA